MRGHVHVCRAAAHQMAELTVGCESQLPDWQNDTQQLMHEGKWRKRKPHNNPKMLHKTPEKGQEFSSNVQSPAKVYK